MRYSLGVAALAAGLVAAQGPSTTLLPSSQPSGCASTYDNGAAFQIGILNATAALSQSKRSVHARAAGGTLMLTLKDGILTDLENNGFGYVAGNNQVQFNNPVQAGALVTAGWTACPNGTLALASTYFYECLTTGAGGSYYNLYDEPVGTQCAAAFLMIIPPAGASTTGTAAPTMTVQPVSQISDGQIQASTGVVTITPSVATVTATATGTGTISPIWNSTSTLPPFTGGAASHPVFSTNGAALYGAFVGAIALGAFLL